VSLTITERPIATVGPNTSKYTAIHNPVIYKAQRRDHEVTEIQTAAGKIRIDVAGDITTELTIGDTLYLRTLDFTVNYDQNVTIDSFLFTSGETRITTNETVAETSTTSDSFINLLTDRPAYFAEVELFKAIDDTLLLLAPLEYIPNGKGSITMRFESYLKPVIDLEVPVVNSINFYIKHLEKWTGSSESKVDDVANDIIATNAAKQLGELFGQNMGEHVTWPAGTPQSKFLNKMVNPVLTVDFLFTISFIYGSTAGVNVIQAIWKNAAGATLRSDGLLVVTNNINDQEIPFTGLSIPTTAKTVELQVVEQFVTVSLNESGQINGLFFEKSGTFGWAVSSAGAVNIWKSIDSGATWAKQTHTATGVLHTVHAIDINTAWVGGSANQTLRTINGGTTWTKVLAAMTVVRGVHFASPSVGWIVGITVTAPAIEKTIDGGVNWVIQTPATPGGTDTLRGVYAISTSIVVAVGLNGTIERTSNGGTTWIDVSPVTSENFQSVDFASTLIGWAAGSNGEIWKSTDGGAVWQDQSVGGSEAIVEIRAFSTLIAFALGVSTLWRTNDGGITWEPRAHNILEDVTDVTLLAIFTMAVINDRQILVGGGDSNETIARGGAGGGAVPVTENLIVDINRDPCKPVTLEWINSLGGKSYWTFEGNQTNTVIFPGNVKRIEQLLFATGLTDDQWDALNELNTLGGVFGLNVEDLETETKDRIRSGVQVNVIETDGSKTGVIVIPFTNTRDTRTPRHELTIKIEYPEIFQLK